MSDARHRNLWCVACAADVSARLTNGRECYPHRPDLAALPFWRCDACGNWTGCHHKTNNPTRPLGCIPSAEMKDARQHIHAVLDPLWKAGRNSRKSIYAQLSEVLGREYHTAELRTMDEARLIWRAVKEIERERAAAQKTMETTNV